MNENEIADLNLSKKSELLVSAQQNKASITEIDNANREVAEAISMRALVSDLVMQRGNAVARYQVLRSGVESLTQTTTDPELRSHLQDLLDAVDLLESF